MRYPEPSYTLYKEKQADNRNFQKEDENKLSSFGTQKASFNRDIPDANFFLKYSKYFIFISHIHLYMVKQTQPS